MPTSSLGSTKSSVANCLESSREERGIELADHKGECTLRGEAVGELHLSTSPPLRLCTPQPPNAGPCALAQIDAVVLTKIVIKSGSM